MEILTGYRGTPHITSAQDRFKNQGIVGAESYVFALGGQLAATITSPTQVQIADGILCHQGCVACIEHGNHETLTIQNGTQGMNRVDLIVARYARNSSTNVEAVNLVVVTGTPSSGTPGFPTIYNGDIQAGDSPVDMDLYEIHLNGVTISSIISRKKTVAPIKELDDACAELADEKLDVDGDSRGNIVTYSSGDSSTPTMWTPINVLTSGEYHFSIMEKLSTAVKNLRYIWNLIGSGSFTNVGATIAQAIGNSALNTTASNLSGAVNELEDRTRTRTASFVRDTAATQGGIVTACRVGDTGHIYGYLTGLQANSIGSSFYIGTVNGMSMAAREIWFLGRLRPGTLSPIPGSSGTAPEDVTGYVVALQLETSGRIKIYLPVTLGNRINCLTFQLSFPIGL